MDAGTYPIVEVDDTVNYAAGGLWGGWGVFRYEKGGAGHPLLVAGIGRDWQGLTGFFATPPCRLGSLAFLPTTLPPEKMAGLCSSGVEYVLTTYIDDHGGGHLNNRINEDGRTLRVYYRAISAPSCWMKSYMVIIR